MAAAGFAGPPRDAAARGAVAGTPRDLRGDVFAHQEDARARLEHLVPPDLVHDLRTAHKDHARDPAASRPHRCCASSLSPPALCPLPNPRLRAARGARGARPPLRARRRPRATRPPAARRAAARGAGATPPRSGPAWTAAPAPALRNPRCVRARAAPAAAASLEPLPKRGGALPGLTRRPRLRPQQAPRAAARAARPAWRAARRRCARPAWAHRSAPHLCARGSAPRSARRGTCSPERLSAARHGAVRRGARRGTRGRGGAGARGRDMSYARSLA